MNMKSAVLIAMVVIVLGFIVMMSRQTATVSNGISMQVSSFIRDIAVKVIPEESVNLRQLNSKIREYAHFTAYMFFAIVLYFALRHFGVSSSALWAIAICLGLAIVDEYMQTFVAGRGGEIKDVLMDGMGAVTGVLLASIIKFVMKNRSTS